MRAFLIAGEPSGDKLGGALMSGLKQLCPDMSFDGVGGSLMQAQGLVSRFPMEELSVMGIAEVLPRYFDLKRRIAEMAQAVLDTRPDVLITIDSPDFCLRVAKLVKAQSDIRTVHYVAPTVWAWRPGRASKMAHMIDHVLALFPFEPPYMEAAGMVCDFVGHPVVAEPVPSAEDEAALRATFDLGDAPVMLALPGSRKSEVGRLAPVFGEGLRRALQNRPDMRVVVPAAEPVADLVEHLVRDWPDRPIILRGGGTEEARRLKRGAFRAAEVALAASGTVSLELAAAGTPMVIAYSFNWLSWQIISRMVRVDTAVMVNLVSETRAVPECLGPECTGSNIAAALAGVLSDPSAQQDAMRATMDRLGMGEEDPGLRAARAVLNRLPGSPGTA
nr:lipid-A-disaccharide synthase [Thalassococcus sp. S3]